MSIDCCRRGFTLAELLTALLILGVISTFTIPKILNAQQNSQKTAVFKEDISFLQAGIYTYIQQGNMSAASHACGTASPADAIAIIQSITNYQKKVGDAFYYPNGSSITVHSGDVLDFQIDWNGSSGNNLAGDDQIHYHFNDCTGTWANIPSGRFGVIDTDTADTELYESLFNR